MYQTYSDGKKISYVIIGCVGIIVNTAVVSQKEFGEHPIFIGMEVGTYA